jgi:hypothetical protein
MLTGQACGGDAGDAGKAAPVDVGATEADIAEWCGVGCERSQRCQTSDGEDEPSCAATCMAEFWKPELIQQRVAQAFQDCFSELPCGQSDDSCFAIVVATLDLELTSPLAQRCLSVQNECDGFSEDSCSFAVVATSAGRTRLDQCLSSACDAVPECIAALSE